ncbi:hypothetical protein BGX38DRAFT_1157389 [Terfezia claveryi]|nr:hypothetical protein BGX38DRAFT_1157389 [Terfezia claveryi]
MAAKPATAPKPPRASAYGAAALAVNPKRCGAGFSLWESGISSCIAGIGTHYRSLLTLGQI